MRSIILSTVVFLLFVFASAIPAEMIDDYPCVTISNGTMELTMFVPDVEKGAYRGRRFEWASQAWQLTWNGHTFFAQRHFPHVPESNNSFGIAAEFNNGVRSACPVRYDEAKPGETFMKIGVGNLVQTNQSTRYNRGTPYEFASTGKWTTQYGTNWIQFTHVLADDYGYAYKYIKRFEIPFDRNELKISHTLYNTGEKMITGTHYTHNFTTIDNAKSSEDYEVELAFDGKFSSDIDEYATISGNKITFPGAPDKPFGSTIEGYTGDITENHVKIVNRRLGVGLDIKGDYPIREFMFYVDTLSVCPEMYTYFDIPVGALYSWNITYIPYEQ